MKTTSASKQPLRFRGGVVSFCLVSKQDVALVSAHIWYLTPNGYALTHIKGKTVYMHRLIMRPKKGFVVDHKDGNKLNNTRRNLRVVSQSLNVLCMKSHSRNKSGHIGLFYRPSRPARPWVAHGKVGATSFSRAFALKGDAISFRKAKIESLLQQSA